MKVLVAICLGVLSLGAQISKGADPMDLYVSTDGKDTWAGTKARPLATLTGARNAIRRLRKAGKATGPVTVHVRGGTYPMARTFALTRQDSGAPGAAVVYRAYRDETVRLLGGRVVGGFAPVTDPAILKRLAPTALAKVRQCDLKGQGVVDLGRLRSRGFGRPVVPAHMELFFDGAAATLARWPNEGFVEIAGYPASGRLPDRHGGSLGKLSEGFHYSGDRPKRWQASDDIWVHGYWAWDWANTYERVASIDTKARRIKTRRPHGIYGFRKGARYYFLNVLEELDRPGEYYVDRAAGVLYFWPPKAIAGRETLVSMLETPVIAASNVSHVTIRGLNIECTRGSGIEVRGGEKVLVAGCTLRNIGTDAVSIAGGRAHAVLGCDVSETGDSGIGLHGGDRKTLTPAGHRAENNHVHHVGRWSRCYRPAVGVTGVGNRVAHNHIHHSPHNGIHLAGNEHVIEFNEIHHVCLETGDVGAFYMGRDWTMRGNVIRHNFFHHLRTAGRGGSMAVYLDDCASGTKVYGNIFYKAHRAAFIGGGRDNVVENNLFVDCDPAVQIDGRGLVRGPVWPKMVYETMKRRLEAMNWRKPPYATRYPKLADLVGYYANRDGIPPEGNRIVRNVCAGKWLVIHWGAKPEHVDVRDNVVGRDVLIVDRKKLTFRVPKSSPAWKLGFKAIPVEKIGLRVSRYRPTGKAR